MRPTPNRLLTPMSAPGIAVAGRGQAYLERTRDAVEFRAAVPAEVPR